MQLCTPRKLLPLALWHTAPRGPEAWRTSLYVMAKQSFACCKICQDAAIVSRYAYWMEAPPAKKIILGAEVFPDSVIRAVYAICDACLYGPFEPDQELPLCCCTVHDQAHELAAWEDG